MSWEESKPEPHECPCGSGQYIVVRRSDDWNRFDERWTMQCSQCKKDYGLYAFDSSRKGIPDTSYAWVPRLLLEKLKDLRAQMHSEERGLGAYLTAQYGSAWRSLFAGNSKKQTWTILTENGQKGPSLSTFYSHTRHFGLEKIVNDSLRYEDAGLICRTLKIEDRQIDSTLRRVAALLKEVQKTERKIRERLFL